MLPQFQFDDLNNMVSIKLNGQLTERNILEAFDLAVKNPQYKNGMGRLWDFREADLSKLSTTTIQSMAKYSLKFPPGINDVRVAFVIGRDLEYGLARMFEAFSSKAHTLISIFDDVNEAETWLSS